MVVQYKPTMNLLIGERSIYQLAVNKIGLYIYIYRIKNESF